MHLDKFSDTVLALEKKYPVWSWECNGVLIWPLIRTKLYLQLKKQKQSASTHNVNGLKKTAFLFSGCFTFFRLLFAGKRRAVVLSNAAFRSKVDQYFVDRVADPVMSELMVQKKDPMLFEFATNLEYRKPSLHESSIVRVQPFYLLLSSLLKPRSLNLHLSQWDQFIQELETQWPGCSKTFSEKRLRNIVSAWWSNVRAWKVILRMVKPEVVFVNCFYDDKGLAMVGAAKILKTKVVDLQHGIQGKYHLAYTQWNRPLPASSVVPLPDYFFVWDNASAENIQGGNEKSNVTGYPWIEAWKRGVFKINVPLPENIILYTLQPLDDPFPANLVTLLKSLPKESILFVRVHPHELSNLPLYKSMFSELGLDITVEFEIASNLPLPYLLTKTAVHLTKWSTVALEASLFNVPTLLLHPTGVDLFSGQIPSHLLYYEKTIQEVMKNISQRENLDIASTDLLSTSIKEVYEC